MKPSLGARSLAAYKAAGSHRFHHLLLPVACSLARSAIDFEVEVDRTVVLETIATYSLSLLYLTVASPRCEEPVRAEAIHRCVIDQLMRQRAADLGAKIRAEDGVANAVAIIQKLEKLRAFDGKVN